MPDTTIVLARLNTLTAATVDPVVDPGTLASVLASYACADVSGVLPAAAGWAGAWDVYGAAGEVWRLKCALGSDRFTFSADRQLFNRDQVFLHSMQMAEFYENRAGELILGPDGKAVSGNSLSMDATTVYTDPTVNDWWLWQGLLP